MNKKKLLVEIAQHVPQAAVSRAWGWVARRRRPRLGVEILKRVFVAGAGIDMTEAAAGVGAYANLQELFTRELRGGVRQIDADPAAVISPVDAAVGMCGEVAAGTLFQVKGRSYTLERLFGGSAGAEVERYEGGAYATFYLSPHDYHRIHAPVSGVVREATLIPGQLLPVFPEALHAVDELFARNERVITYLDTEKSGRVAVVKVGATLVGSIRVTYDAGLCTNRPGQTHRNFHYDPPHVLHKGMQLGSFELGSTVVLVAERGCLSWLASLAAGQVVRMGERIGTLHSGGAASARRQPTRSAGGRERRAGRQRRP